MEELKSIISKAKQGMDKAVSHTNDELNKIRAGKAQPDMLNSIMVSYYGAETPLNALAAVTAPEARTLSIKPFDKSTIKDIEKAIIDSNLGFTPQNNGESIMINLPPMTEERRGQLVKQAKGVVEDGKIGVRNTRQDANNALKKLKGTEGISDDMIKDAEGDVQKMTDNHTKKIDDLFSAKETEIMTV